MKYWAFFWIIFFTISSFPHPLVSINLSTNKPFQGDAIWVKINTSKQLKSGHIRLGKKRFKLFNKNKSKNELLSCIGISRYLKPKSTRLKFTFTFTDNSQYQTSLPIEIKNANFKKEHIKLKPRKYKLSQDKTSRSNENQIIGKKFRVISKKKKYAGPFIWPVKGRFTSEFGTQRVYNNKPGWKHSGIDISASRGAPIKAAQNGKIILAKPLKVHGNTVMIDHGMGIISIYNHLDKIKVINNQLVTKGALIGTVGSTGIATGDHLHFGISIQSIRVNPRTWLEKTSVISI